jgi:hypothetical protein
MYHSTGFTKAEIAELCVRIEARELTPGMRRWPPVLGLHNALTVTLAYLRASARPDEAARIMRATPVTAMPAHAASSARSRVAVRCIGRLNRPDYYERHRDIRRQIAHHVGKLGSLSFEVTLCRIPEPEPDGTGQTKTA